MLIEYITFSALPSTSTASGLSALPTDALSSIACRACGAIDLPRISPGNGPHFARADCRHCGSFVQWLSRYSPEERARRRASAIQIVWAATPPTAPQLTYLRALGDSGAPPTSMAEASQRIVVLQQKKGVAS